MRRYDVLPFAFGRKIVYIKTLFVWLRIKATFRMAEVSVGKMMSDYQISVGVEGRLVQGDCV